MQMKYIYYSCILVILFKPFIIFILFQRLVILVLCNLQQHDAQGDYC